VEKVGFVGLGIMGAPMAANLLEAGHDLVVHNRTRTKAEQLMQYGALVADSPREVAELSDISITMLPGPFQVEEVVARADGLLEGAKEGSLIVDMSTSSPHLAQELARTARERGVGMLDAPVSGGDVGARNGTLSIMVGGEEGDFERARPLFEVMGETVIHVGGAGAGQVVKACNQIVVALVIEAVAEALVLGSKAGVKPEKTIEVLSGGLAANKVMEVKRDKFLEHDFEPGGKAEFHRKDLGIALEAGREYGVPLPVTAVVCQMFETLMAKGRGGWDHSSLLTIIEDLAQHEITQPTRERSCSPAAQNEDSRARCYTPAENREDEPIRVKPVRRRPAIGGVFVEQIVARGLLERKPAGSRARHALIDETTGEVLYTLSDPRRLLEGRIGDLIQVHGTVVETEGDIPLLEITRVD
jgi:2-hydroxy-3-oxopropionate reductase